MEALPGLLIVGGVMLALGYVIHLVCPDCQAEDYD